MIICYWKLIISYILCKSLPELCMLNIYYDHHQFDETLSADDSDDRDGVWPRPVHTYLDIFENWYFSSIFAFCLRVTRCLQSLKSEVFEYALQIGYFYCIRADGGWWFYKECMCTHALYGRLAYSNWANMIQMHFVWMQIFWNTEKKISKFKFQNYPDMYGQDPSVFYSQDTWMKRTKAIFDIYLLIS